MCALVKLHDWRHRLFVGLIALGVAALCVPSATASPITFAQFMQSTTSAEPFVYTNNSNGATFDAATFNATLVIASSFLPPGTNTIQAATVTLTSSTSTPATQTGSSLLQSFPTVANDTIQITLANAINGSKNFLTVTYTGHLGANVNSSTAGLTASQAAGDTVNFSSGVLNFKGTTDYGFALSFSALTPTLQLGTGGFYNSFTASGTGTFHLTPATTVPEPGTLVIFGSMLSAFAGAGVFLRKARALIAHLF